MYNLLYDIKSRTWRIYLIMLNLSHTIDLIITNIGGEKLNIWGNSYIYFFTLHKSIMFKFTIWHKFENVTAIFNSNKFIFCSVYPLGFLDSNCFLYFSRKIIWFSKFDGEQARQEVESIRILILVWCLVSIWFNYYPLEYFHDRIGQ